MLRLYFPPCRTLTRRAATLRLHLVFGYLILLYLFAAVPALAQSPPGLRKPALSRSPPVVRIENVQVDTDTARNTVTIRAVITNVTQRSQSIGLFVSFSSATPKRTWNYPEAWLTLPLAPGESSTFALPPLAWTPGRASWWWPNVPFRADYRAVLHRVTLRGLGADVKTLVAAPTSATFGFRSLVSTPRQNTFNGVPVFLRGDTLSETAIGPEAFTKLLGFGPARAGREGWPQTVRRYQRLNVNALYFPDTAPTPAMLRVCDELGEMVILSGQKVEATHPCLPTSATGDRPALPAAPGLVSLPERFHTEPTLTQALERFQRGENVPQNLTWTALGLRAARREGVEDAFPGRLWQAWPGLARTPVTDPVYAIGPFVSQIKVRPQIDDSEPWTNPYTLLIQRSFAPVALHDPTFDEANTVSNGAGAYPVVTPTLAGGEKFTRRLALYNDEFTSGEFQVVVEPVLRPEQGKPTRYPALLLPTLRLRAGEHRIPTYTFTPPALTVNTPLEFTLIVRKEGVERYRETVAYTLLATGRNRANATFVGTDRQTKGDYSGKYGHEAFLVPVELGQSIFTGPNAYLIRAVGDPIREPRRDPGPLHEEGGGGFQATLANVGNPLKTTDPRAAVSAPGQTERYAVQFAGARLPVYFTATSRDGKPHNVSLYLVDFARLGLKVDVTVTDVQGHPLDTRTVDNYGDGLYLTWRFEGRVVIWVRSLDKTEAMAGGVFIDPA